MTTGTKPETPQKVNCEVCLKEIPKTDAKCTEVHDYVMYFCGLDCYQEWSSKNEEKNIKKAGNQ